MSNVHALINKERRQRHLPHVYWSKEMARLAQSQANYCAKEGHLVHSNRFAFKGGENLAQGGNRFSAKAIVNCWLGSHQGHREYLLSSKVTKAGIGISKRHGKTFVAWAFSDAPPTYPDCPSLKNKQIRTFSLKNFLGIRKSPKKMNLFKLIFSILLGCFGLLGILLGAHSIYVYFNRLSLLVNGDAEKLFLTVTVPSSLRPAVSWASERGFQSWVIPALILLGGLWLLNYSRLWRLISGWLNRIKP